MIGDTRISERDGWDWLAEACAREAHVSHFPSRRGIFCVQDEDDPSDEGILVIYNNHPYAAHPLRREAELGEIRSRLAAEGIPEVGFATHPQGGPADGYSFALVLGVGDGWQDFVEELVREATRAAWKDDR